MQCSYVASILVTGFNMYRIKNELLQFSLLKYLPIINEHNTFPAIDKSYHGNAKAVYDQVSFLLKVPEQVQ